MSICSSSSIGFSDGGVAVLFDGLMVFDDFAEVVVISFFSSFGGGSGATDTAGTGGDSTAGSNFGGKFFHRLLKYSFKT